MPTPSSAPVLSVHRPHFYVVLLAAAILALALMIGRTSLFAGAQRELVLAIVVDALVTLPVAYWLLLVRPGHVRLGSILPVVILSYIALSLTVPASRDLPGLKWIFIALEPILIGLVIWRIRRFRRRVAGSEASTLPDRLNEALSGLVDNPTIAGMVATELTVIAYALGLSRRPPELQPGQRHFTHHRRSGARAAVGALAFICLVEAVVVHLLVQRWNPAVAWVLTALSLYAVLWLVGYLRSLSLLPSTVGSTNMILRNGLLETVSIDLGGLADLRPYRAADAQDPTYAGITPPLTQPTHVLELTAPGELHRMFGRRRSARAIGVALDDPAGFAQAIGR